MVFTSPCACEDHHVNTIVEIPIDQLRVGMYIQLDLSWVQHPFPLGSFRVSTQEQIDTVRGLGLQSVRYLPGRSDAEFRQPAVDAPPGVDTPGETPTSGEQTERPSQPAALHIQRDDTAEQLRQQLLAQHAALAA